MGKEWLEEKQGHKIKIKVAEEGHYLTLIKIAKKNYPDIIECGDAFYVRDKNWKY